jgi:hypothetical protein
MISDALGNKYLACCHNAPAVGYTDSDVRVGKAQWRNVDPNWWCGDGADKDSGQMFSAGVQQQGFPVWTVPNPKGSPLKLLHINAAGSYLVKGSSGWLVEFSVNSTAVSGSLTMYDGLDATGAVMAVVDASKGTVGGSTTQPWPFATGLFVVMTGNADCTIVTY